jgi:hypothetical protein
MRAAIRNYNDADEEIIRVKREARVAAIEEAATVIEEHWIGTTGRLETTRDCLDLSDVQETIRALAAAPPEADVMELAREMMEHDLGDVEYIARALTTYGDQRAREGAMRAAIRNYNDSDEEIIRARREAHVAAIEAVKEALIPTPDTLTNEWAFGWEHARDKALLALHALAAAPPQSADTQE